MELTSSGTSDHPVRSPDVRPNSTAIRQDGSIRVALERDCIVAPRCGIRGREAASRRSADGVEPSLECVMLNPRTPVVRGSAPARELTSAPNDMAVSSPRLPIGSANYYELLELPPFETDTVRIQDRLREKAREFRKYQVGPYASQAEACLNALAQARRCLLDAQQKSRYDEQLRNKFDLPPLFVRASLPPDAEDTKRVAWSHRWTGIVARGLNFPMMIWSQLRQRFVRSQPPQPIPASPLSDPATEVPAVLEPPPASAPWITVPVSETGPVSQAS